MIKGTWEGVEYIDGKKLATYCDVTFKNGEIKYATKEIIFKDGKYMYSYIGEVQTKEINSIQLKGNLIHLDLDGNSSIRILGIIMVKDVISGITQNFTRYGIWLGIRVKMRDTTIKDIVLDKYVSEDEFKQYKNKLVTRNESKTLSKYDWVFKNFLKYD